MWVSRHGQISMMIDILLRVNAEESRAVGVSGLNIPTPTEQPASANLKGCSRSEAGAGGTAGGAKPPVLLLLFSTIYGVQAQALFLPQGRRQALANSELLSVVFSSSRAQHLHRFIVGTDRSPDWFR
jgi:hypothetical protein